MPEPGGKDLATDASGLILQVKAVKKHSPIRGDVLLRTIGHVSAVDGVSFSIGQGETLGLVGESGCGQTSVGKTVVRLIEPTAGEIRLRSEDHAICVDIGSRQRSGWLPVVTRMLLAQSPL